MALPCPPAFSPALHRRSCILAVDVPGRNSHGPSVCPGPRHLPICAPALLLLGSRSPAPPDVARFIHACVRKSPSALCCSMGSRSLTAPIQKPPTHRYSAPRCFLPFQSTLSQYCFLLPSSRRHPHITSFPALCPPRYHICRSLWSSHVTVVLHSKINQCIAIPHPILTPL